ncbi:hypothetical protein R3P38DRAFT_2801118 [Favolaschia claudopus]|uniref:Uncharacterized protein n=1 Tax=Favolaschia claudopus TaxID=2862362 RepID=A0AAV9ZWI0_9AGAR
MSGDDSPRLARCAPMRIFILNVSPLESNLPKNLSGECNAKADADIDPAISKPTLASAYRIRTTRGAASGSGLVCGLAVIQIAFDFSLIVRIYAKKSAARDAIPGWGGKKSKIKGATGRKAWWRGRSWSSDAWWRYSWMGRAGYEEGRNADSIRGSRKKEWKAEGIITAVSGRRLLGFESDTSTVGFEGYTGGHRAHQLERWKTGTRYGGAHHERGFLNGQLERRKNPTRRGQGRMSGRNRLGCGRCTVQTPRVGKDKTIEYGCASACVGVAGRQNGRRRHVEVQVKAK